MPAYAIAHLRRVTIGPAIVEYLQRIDATLDSYGGRFLIHGGPVDILEGEWIGDLVVIEFPNRENAHAWYAGPEYQAILRLRTDNAEGDTFIIDGVPEGYRGADVLAKLLPASA
jgi:uncharacterized protein (DUF1330 family)